jgi:acetolactate synthase-1/2/3 large subunit
MFHKASSQLGKPRTAAQALVDQLVIHGVEHIFCVPGESFLGVLDALIDSPITVTVCRQEGGAAMMAEAVGKATGKPGVCFVTRGPGATNASAGIHIAHQDSTPMIMFVGQVERGLKDRESFQELDYRAVFGSMTKWTTEIDVAERVPELVSQRPAWSGGGSLAEGHAQRADLGRGWRRLPDCRDRGGRRRYGSAFGPDFRV